MERYYLIQLIVTVLSIFNLYNHSACIDNKSIFYTIQCMKNFKGILKLS